MTDSDVSNVENDVLENAATLDRSPNPLRCAPYVVSRGSIPIGNCGMLFFCIRKRRKLHSADDTRHGIIHSIFIFV